MTQLVVSTPTPSLEERRTTALENIARHLDKIDDSLKVLAQFLEANWDLQHIVQGRRS